MYQWSTVSTVLHSPAQTEAAGDLLRVGIPRADQLEHLISIIIFETPTAN